MTVGHSQQQRSEGSPARRAGALAAALVALVALVVTALPAAGAPGADPAQDAAAAPTTGVPTTGVAVAGAPTTDVPTAGVPTTDVATSGVPGEGPDADASALPAIGDPPPGDPAPRDVAGEDGSTSGADPPGTDAVIAVPEAPDYASEVLGNPWDFGDDADRLWLQQSKVWAPRGGGAITYEGNAYNTLYLLNAWGGDLPHGRDGRVVPVDADRYGYVSFKATVTNLASPTAGGIFWFNCVSLAPSCFGARSYQLVPGTKVYTVPVHLGSASVGGATAPWTGDIAKLWVAATGSPSLQPNVSIDWIRVHGDTGNPTTDPYPPGTHTIGAQDYAIDARPRPVVLDPDLAGGDDYAETVRGDPWDMNAVTDLAGWLNATVTVAGGVANGSSAGEMNNPLVWFGAPELINTRRWHRLTLRVAYDGPFGLGDDFGMVGRWVWTNDAAPPHLVQESNDVLVYPGDQEIVLDLHTTPVAAVNDEATTNPQGWGGPGSTLVRQPRWDPHEGFNPKTWRIDEVRLARNDIADPDFTIRFREDPATFEPGTTAEVALVTAPGLLGGVDLTPAPLPVAAGENAVVLDAATLAVQGTYWVRVDMTDPGGATTSAWSSGPVETSTPFEFIDVLPGDAFYWDIRWLVKAKIATGYTADEYRPTNAISRQAMAAFLYRQAGAPGGTDPACTADPFSDVGVGGLFCGEIAWLADQGIAGGYPDGSFGATRPISRQAMAAFLYRAANPGGGDPAPCAVAPFPDVAVDSPFCGHITWMAGTGITGGYVDGTFRPANAVSRQAMAKFLRVFDGL